VLDWDYSQPKAPTNNHKNLPNVYILRPLATRSAYRGWKYCTTETVGSIAS